MLGDVAGNVVALVIEYDDGAADEEREVVVPIDRVQLVEGENHLMTTLSDAELGQMPEWQD